MWFSRTGGRRSAKQQAGVSEPASPSKPLLNEEQLIYQPSLPASTNGSPTKPARHSLVPPSPSTTQGGRIDFPKTTATPTITHDYALTEIPSRLSASSSAGGHGRPSLTIPNSALLSPPNIIRSQRPSTVHLPEETELEGADRLFDPFTGKAVATLSSKQDLFTPTQGLRIGSQLDLGRNRGMSANGEEDPARQKMWDYLAKIRSLQAEVAAMHLAMDGHGLGDPWGAQRPMHSRAGSMSHLGGTKDKSPFLDNLSTPRINEPTPSTRGVRNDSDDEGEGKKKDGKAEEFGELDKMFERKQEALKGVMSKLKELSSVVRQYHELENPVISAYNRQDTLESRPDFLTDSPGRKVLPPTQLTPTDPGADSSNVPTQRPTPKPTLAPIFTASPLSSIGSHPELPLSSKVPASGQLSSARSGTPLVKRTSMDMGTGGGPHGYIPPSLSSPGPLPLPSPPLPRHSLSANR